MILIKTQSIRRYYPVSLSLKNWVLKDQPKRDNLFPVGFLAGDVGFLAG
jgi:hypothetical protein